MVYKHKKYSVNTRSLYYSLRNARVLRAVALAKSVTGSYVLFEN